MSADESSIPTDKRCSKCGRLLPVESFSRDRRKRDGRFIWCKKCQAEQCNLWRAEHPQQIRDYSARYYAEHREEISARAAARHAEHPERRSAGHAVRNAIRDGRMERGVCEVCGAEAEGHHDDYSRPLDVRWLCPRHHRQHHVSRSLSNV